jgi:hypothetical protein
VDGLFVVAAAVGLHLNLTNSDVDRERHKIRCRDLTSRLDSTVRLVNHSRGLKVCKSRGRGWGLMDLRRRQSEACERLKVKIL